MATSGARSGRSVPEILRQNCYLTDAVPIPQADPSSKRGKFLHRHCHPTYHFWIARRDTANRCIISVFDTRKGSSPGSLLGEMWYPASAEIIDACICRFDMGQPGLVVAVYDAARQEYPYYLSYVVIGLGYVVKTIGMDFPITSVTCLMDSAEVPHRRELAPEFAGFPQIVVVGTEQGHCFLTHFGVSRIDAPPLDVDVRTPVKPPRSIDCSKPYQKKTGGFQPAYTNEDNVPPLNSSDVMVTSLCYVARCYTLFIGYNFGAVQTLNLATKSIGMMHVSPGPVISFAIQEPEDDPRPQLFLWIGCNGRRDARPVLKLYVVNFASSEKDVEATYETAIYSKPMVHPFLEWFPEECSRLISLRTVYMRRSEADQIRKEDGEPSIIGAGGGFGSEMTSTLVLCSWIAKRSDSIKFHGSLFDLNNLYFRRLARRIETDKTPAKQFHTMAVFSSAECETSEFVLKANEINDVVMDTNYGLTRFKNKSSDYADQLQYPSTYQFKCFALTNTQLGDLRVPPLQRQVLERYAINLRDIVEKPMLPSQYLRAIGIHSQNAAQLKSKPDLALILSAMLYYDHVDEILSLVENLKESLTSNVTLKDIAEWVWREVEMTKKRLDEIANLFRTNTITHLSPEAKRFISHACYVFQMASMVLSALTERVSGSAKEKLEVKYEATKALQLYANLIQFFLEFKVLPETDATVATLDRIRKHVEDARGRAEVAGIQLNLFEVLKRIYEYTDDDQLWGSEGADEWYPPVSVMSIIDIALLNGIHETWRLNLIGYFLADHAWQSEPRDSMRTVYKRFGSRFLEDQERHSFNDMWWADQRAVFEPVKAPTPPKHECEVLMEYPLLTEEDYEKIRTYLITEQNSPAKWNKFILERRQFDRLVAAWHDGSGEYDEVRLRNIKNLVEKVLPFRRTDLPPTRLFRSKVQKPEMPKPIAAVAPMETDEAGPSGFEIPRIKPPCTPANRKREYTYDLPDEEDVDEPPMAKRAKSCVVLDDSLVDALVTSPANFLPTTPVVNRSLIDTQRSLRGNDFDRVRRVLATPPPSIRRRQPLRNPMRTPEYTGQNPADVCPPTSILRKRSPNGTMLRSRLNIGRNSNSSPLKIKFVDARNTKHVIEHAESTDDSSIFSETSFKSAGDVDSYTSFKSTLNTSIEEQGEEDFAAEIAAEKHHEEKEFEPIVVDEMIEVEPAVDEPEAQLEPIVEEALNTSMEEQGEVDFAAEIAAEHHEEKELEPIVVDEMIEVEPAVDEPEAQLEPIVEEEEEKTPKEAKVKRKSRATPTPVLTPRRSARLGSRSPSKERELASAQSVRKTKTPRRSTRSQSKELDVESIVTEPEAQLEPIVEEEEEKTPTEAKMKRKSRATPTPVLTPRRSARLGSRSPSKERELASAQSMKKTKTPRRSTRSQSKELDVESIVAEPEAQLEPIVEEEEEARTPKT